MKKIAGLLIALITIFSAFSIRAFATNPKITVDDVYGKPGGTVNVDVKISDNPGIVGMRIKLTYDKDVLTLTDVTNGKVFDEALSLFGNDKSAVPYYMLWDDSLNSDNNTKNGRLVRLSFKISENVKVDSAKVNISVDEKSTFNTELNTVLFDSDSAVVHIKGVTTTQADLNGIIKSQIKETTTENQNTTTQIYYIESDEDGVSIITHTDTSQEQDVTSSASVSQEKTQANHRNLMIYVGIVLAVLIIGIISALLLKKRRAKK